VKNRQVSKAVIGFSIAMIASIPVALADDASPTPASPPSKLPPDLARRVQEITEVVLEQHIDPPARQQMILSGIKALYRSAGRPAPAGLGGRVSALATPDQFAALLADAWPKATDKPVAAKALEAALLDGLLAVVPGGAELMSAKDRKVSEQIEGNRYVGIHIALSMDRKAKLTNLFEVFPGGPADRAGCKKGDLLEEIDGVSTRGMPLRDVVEKLRGEEGTDVTIKVRQPDETKSRTMTMTRGQLPRTTIQGVRKRPDGDWDTRLEGPAEGIGYLKITEISASTPHELRKRAQQLEMQGIRTLILDLRGANHSNAVHPAVMLADCLLERGAIGRVRTARGDTVYQADSDALFRGWPITVLVDANTSGTAEWLAAALQDNHRATIVGSPTAGAMIAREAFGRMAYQSGVRSRVAVGDGSWSIELTTGYLERGDGRPLSPRDDTPADLALQQGTDPQEVKTGVKPDHLVPQRPVVADQPRARVQGPAYPPVQEKPAAPPSSDDPSMEKAIQELRRSLKAN
jgi:carboxyl-terminal processing protease